MTFFIIVTINGLLVINPTFFITQKQVFIPPERCVEERKEREIEMERKFDEIYLQQDSK